MARTGKATRTVVFKADAEMADLLDSLPNRSEFIRRAILGQIHRNCPLCRGAGVVPIGIGEHYAEAFASNDETSDRRSVEQIDDSLGSDRESRSKPREPSMVGE